MEIFLDFCHFKMKKKWGKYHGIFPTGAPENTVFTGIPESYGKEKTGKNAKKGASKRCGM